MHKLSSNQFLTLHYNCTHRTCADLTTILHSTVIPYVWTIQLLFCEQLFYCAMWFYRFL